MTNKLRDLEDLEGQAAVDPQTGAPYDADASMLHGRLKVIGAGSEWPSHPLACISVRGVLQTSCLRKRARSSRGGSLCTGHWGKLRQYPTQHTIYFLGVDFGIF